MAKFNCTMCGYSTNRKTKPEICPYCSKKDVMKEEESAGEILDEA